MFLLANYVLMVKEPALIGLAAVGLVVGAVMIWWGSKSKPENKHE